MMRTAVSDSIGLITLAIVDSRCNLINLLVDSLSLAIQWRIKVASNKFGNVRRGYVLGPELDDAQCWYDDKQRDSIRKNHKLNPSSP